MSGKIIDKRNKKPIPFVIISSGKYQISANSDGEFVFPNINVPSKLTFSHLSYLCDTFFLTKDSLFLTIYLNPVIIELNEIKISKDEYARELIIKAYEKLIRQSATILYGNALYRQFSYLNETPIECQEIVYDLKMNNFKILAANVFQGRYAVAAKSVFKFRNFSVNTFLNSFLDGTQEKGYSFRLDSTLTFKIIDFLMLEGKPEIAKIRVKNEKKKRESLVMINIENFNLYRLTHVNEERNIHLDHPATKFKNQRNVWEISFRENGDSSLCIDYIDVKVTLNYEQYFKSNTLELNSHTFFYKYQNEAKKNLDYNYYSNQKVVDRDEIDKLPYDPEFWNHDEVFKRTQKQDSIIALLTKKELSVN